MYLPRKRLTRCIPHIRGVAPYGAPIPMPSRANFLRRGKHLADGAGFWRRQAPVQLGDCEGVMVGTADRRKPRLLDEVCRCLRVKHYSLRMEQAYVAWIRRFILASGKRHPREMGGPEVERFLTGLAVEGRVSGGTQNQALSALLFLYCQSRTPTLSTGNKPSGKRASSASLALRAACSGVAGTAHGP
jgi:hypothetical protein